MGKRKKKTATPNKNETGYGRFNEIGDRLFIIAWLIVGFGSVFILIFLLICTVFNIQLNETISLLAILMPGIVALTIMWTVLCITFLGDVKKYIFSAYDFYKRKKQNK